MFLFSAPSCIIYDFLTSVSIYKFNTIEFQFVLNIFNIYMQNLETSEREMSA